MRTMLSAHLFLLLNGIEKTDANASRTSSTSMILSQKRSRPESVASPSTLRTSSCVATPFSSANCALLLMDAMTMSLETGEKRSHRLPSPSPPPASVVMLSANVIVVLPSAAPTFCIASGGSVRRAVPAPVRANTTRAGRGQQRPKRKKLPVTLRNKASRTIAQ